MRNDTERRAFVENDDNWEEIGAVGFVDNPLIRLSRLEYEGHEWFKVDVWETYTSGYDFENRRHSHKTGWHSARMYRFDPGSKSFNYTVSVTEIRDEIKEIDKEKKNGKEDHNHSR